MMPARVSHAELLPGEAAFAEEVARPEHGDDRFLTVLGDHRQLDPALIAPPALFTTAQPVPCWMR